MDSQDVWVLEGLFKVNQSNAIILFHGMLSPSTQTGTCAGIVEGALTQLYGFPDSRPKWPLMWCVSLIKSPLKPQFPSPKYTDDAGMWISLSLGVESEIWGSTSTPTSPGPHQSPSIQLSFLRIHPVFSTRSVIVAVEIIISHPQDNTLVICLPQLCSPLPASLYYYLFFLKAAQGAIFLNENMIMCPFPSYIFTGSLLTYMPIPKLLSICTVNPLIFHNHPFCSIFGPLSLSL